jgi:hypothetical protein
LGLEGSDYSLNFVSAADLLQTLGSEVIEQNFAVWYQFAIKPLYV